MENWDWAKKVCVVANTTTHWAVTGRAFDAIEALENGNPRTGHDDGYNWETWITPETGEIFGRCGYGSLSLIDVDEVHLQSCGGHWIHAVRGPEDEIFWSTDRNESCSSWGEASQWNIEDGVPIADLQGQELELYRISMLRDNE